MGREWSPGLYPKLSVRRAAALAPLQQTLSTGNMAWKAGSDLFPSPTVLFHQSLGESAHAWPISVRFAVLC
jgi:hypothetical protein